jgi:hypothetical protein
MKLFGQYINDELIYVPIPAKFLINKPIDKNIMNELLFNCKSSLDIEQTYGFPLGILTYHDIELRVISSKATKYTIINEKLFLPYHRKLYSILSYNIFSKEMLFSSVTSYQRINSKINSEKDLYRDIGNARYNIKIYEDDFKITKICIDYFSSIVSKYKTNLKKVIYSKIRLTELDLSNILPKTLCELVIEYDKYDYNHEIVIYDEDNYYRLFDDLLCFRGGMCGQASNMSCSPDAFRNYFDNY